MKFTLKIDPNAQEELFLTMRSGGKFAEEIENLVFSYNGDDLLFCFDEDEVSRLKFEDIECVTVIDRKVYALDRSGKKWRVRERLYELEARLPQYFVRINKSTLANQSKIARFKSTIGGSVDAIFKCGFVDYVSRRCLPELKRRLFK